MLSSVTKVKSINARVIFRYHDNDVSNQVSSNSNNKIKSYSCSNFSTKMGKMKKQEKIFWITNRGKRDQKQGQLLGFQIVARRFQIGTEITSWGEKDFKSGQGLQIGTEHHLKMKENPVFTEFKLWVKVGIFGIFY